MRSEPPSAALVFMALRAALFGATNAPVFFLLLRSKIKRHKRGLTRICAPQFILGVFVALLRKTARALCYETRERARGHGKPAPARLQTSIARLLLTAQTNIERLYAAAVECKRPRRIKMPRRTKMPHRTKMPRRRLATHTFSRRKCRASIFGRAGRECGGAIVESSSAVFDCFQFTSFRRFTKEKTMTREARACRAMTRRQQ